MSKLSVRRQESSMCVEGSRDRGPPLFFPPTRNDDHYSSWCPTRIPNDGLSNMKTPLASFQRAHVRWLIPIIVVALSPVTIFSGFIPNYGELLVRCLGRVGQSGSRGPGSMGVFHVHVSFFFFSSFLSFFFFFSFLFFFFPPFSSSSKHLMFCSS